jgi:hypothetical protein
MIQFDNRGFLKPNAAIETDFRTFEETFVFNPHRQQLFEQYLNYLNELKKIVKTPFEQWIDGSFVSKKPIPNDIDILSFIPSPIYSLEETRLYELKQNSKPTIDAYYICQFPENHRRFVETNGDYYYWLNQFTKDRRKNSKGFIKILFDNE